MKNKLMIMVILISVCQISFSQKQYLLIKGGTDFNSNYTEEGDILGYTIGKEEYKPEGFQLNIGLEYYNELPKGLDLGFGVQYQPKLKIDEDIILDEPINPIYIISRYNKNINNNLKGYIFSRGGAIYNSSMEVLNTKWGWYWAIGTGLEFSEKYSIQFSYQDLKWENTDLLTTAKSTYNSLQLEFTYRINFIKEDFYSRESSISKDPFFTR